MLPSQLAHQLGEITVAKIGWDRNRSTRHHFGIGDPEARPNQHCPAIFSALESVWKRHEQPVVAGIVVFKAHGSVFFCFLLLLHLIRQALSLAGFICRRGSMLGTGFAGNVA